MTTERQYLEKRAEQWAINDDKKAYADFAEKEIALAAPAIKAEGRREAAKAMCGMCREGLPMRSGVEHRKDRFAMNGDLFSHWTDCLAAPIHALLSTPAPKEKA